MPESTPPDPVAARVHGARRSAVFERLEDAVMVLPAAPISFRSRDTEHRYRPDSELFYLTGCTEPGALAVLVGGRHPRFELFVEPRDAEAELWAGPRLGPEAAGERFAADACHATTELEDRLGPLLQAGSLIYYRPRGGDVVGELVAQALTSGRRRGQRQGTGPRGMIDPGEILDELRLRKDAHEIERLRAAVRVSMDGHRVAAATLGPGVGEWEVEAATDATFRRARASGPAYPTIVGSGANACVLHYVDNAGVIGAGELVLIDAGAELDLYSGDITRTYPASGVFSPEQRAVYQVVENARAAGVSAARPGVTLAAIHAAAALVLTEGLVSLGVLEGDPAELMSEDAHKPFYPHQTSHWLGLDVHDPGDYARAGESRVLEPGMVFTVEPGLYFRSAHAEAAGDFAGIGIRIEDDVLITEDGCEVLSADLPTDAAGVEALVAPA